MKNYKEVLKEEIKEIQEAFKKEGYKYLGLEKADGLEYLVILKSGVYFYLSYYSNRIPEFDIDDVIYIRKKRTSCNSENGFEFVDTKVGEFNVDCQLSHGYKMEEEFNAIEDFDTGCFDNSYVRNFLRTS